MGNNSCFGGDFSPEADLEGQRQLLGQIQESNRASLGGAVVETLCTLYPQFATHPDYEIRLGVRYGREILSNETDDLAAIDRVLERSLESEEEVQAANRALAQDELAVRRARRERRAPGRPGGRHEARRPGEIRINEDETAFYGLASHLAAPDLPLAEPVSLNGLMEIVDNPEIEEAMLVFQARPGTLAAAKRPDGPGIVLGRRRNGMIDDGEDAGRESPFAPDPRIAKMAFEIIDGMREARNHGIISKVSDDLLGIASTPKPHAA